MPTQELRRVYMILIDHQSQRVAVNIKDCDLPVQCKRLEGLIHLFGGGIKPDESVMQALHREIHEELRDFAETLDLNKIKEMVRGLPPHIIVFALETDLSGTRTNGRMYALMNATQEGEGAIRSFDFIKKSPDTVYCHPLIKSVILEAIET